MEVAFINEKNLRIKGKQGVLTTNLPAGKGKLASDALLLLGMERTSSFTHEDSGVIIQGPGEYEIKGTKITGFKTDEEVMYTVTIDGLSVFVGNVTSATKTKDKLHEHNIAILFADDVLNQTVMGVLNADVLIFTGAKTEENAKAFDKTFQKIGKYAITKDKLPAETEFVFLG